MLLEYGVLFDSDQNSKRSTRKAERITNESGQMLLAHEVVAKRLRTTNGSEQTLYSPRLPGEPRSVF